MSERIFATCQGEVDGGILAVGFEDGSDHFDAGAGFVDAGFGLEVAFDCADEVDAGVDVTFVVTVAGEGFWFARALSGEGDPFFAGATG